VAETAHTIKKSVEEGNIDGIFDKVHGILNFPESCLTRRVF
jgi:hypothetical protein